MKLAKTAFGLLLVGAVFGPMIFHHALETSILLDENTGLHRVEKWPTEFTESVDHYYAIDHPAVFRWVNRAVLVVAGIEIGEIPQIDYGKSREWNIEHGRAAPRRPVMALRRANAAALVLSMMMLFLLARTALGHWGWGFLVVAPLALSKDLGRYTGAYILADAYLAFFLALIALVWIRFHLASRHQSFARTAIMGLLVGLAVSTKLNAGLLVFAYALYLVVTERGARRTLGPLVFAGTAFVVFVLLNPVMWQGGPLWWVKVLGEMVHRRGVVIQMHREIFGESSFWRRLPFFFPGWYLLPVFAAVLYHARKAKWFLPAALWAGFLIVGTALTANQPLPRYRMPVDMALVTIVMLSAGEVSRRLYCGEMTAMDLLRPSG